MHTPNNQKKIPKNRTMCNNKWSSFNSNYKTNVEYDKGTKIDTCFWDLSLKKKNKGSICLNYSMKTIMK
jgi:hypothetical protein